MVKSFGKLPSGQEAHLYTIAGGGLTAEVTDCGGMVQDVEYGADVTIHAILPQAATENFLSRVVDVSNGRAEGVVLESQYRAFPIKQPIERTEEA